MADKRAFAQFDVGYLDNPKIMEVFDQSPIAVCMHFASVLYCAQHLTDGVITAGPMQRKVGGTSADMMLLVEAGLWHLPGHDCSFCPQPPEGKVYVHDYTEHNRTSDGVKRASEAGKKGAKALWEKKRSEENRDADRMPTAYESHSEPESDSSEIAMAREKERERERKSVLTPSRKKPAHPIPDGWAPNDTHKQYAEAEGIDLTFQAAKFRTHAESKDRRLVNWDAGFKNWLIGADRTKTKPAANSPWSKDFYK